MRALRFILLMIISAVTTGIAQDSMNVQLLDRLYVTCGDVHTVRIDGDLLVTGNLRGGFSIFNHPDTETLELLAYVPVTGLVFDTEIYGDHVFALTDNHGMQIWDISQPESPSRTGFFSYNNPSAYGRALYRVDTLLYAAMGRSGLWIMDISDPAAPDVVGYASRPAWAVNVTVEDTLAFVSSSDDGVYIYDVSEPESPEFISNVATTDYANDAAVYNGYLYVADYRGGLLVIDYATDPFNPQIVGFHDPEEYYYYLAVHGDYLLIEGAPSTVYTFSLDAPLNPEQVGARRVRGGFGPITIEDDVMYVPARSYGLQLMDISDPETLEETAYFPVGGALRDVDVTGNYGFVSRLVHGYSVIDLETPEQPTEVYSDTNCFTYENEIHGDYYFNLVIDALEIYDISDPENPEQVAVISYPEMYALRIAAGDSVAVLAESNSSRFTVLDISDISSPEIISQVDCRDYVYDVAIADSILYVGLYGSVDAYDLRDPANPVELSRCSSMGIFYSITTAGGFVYAVDPGYRKLWSMDFTDPLSPEIADSYSGLDYPEKLVTAADDLLLVADNFQGLQVFNISDPSDIERVGYYPTYGNSYSVDAVGSTVLLADWTSLMVLDVSQATSSVDDAPAVQPVRFALHEPRPNPFNADTRIFFELPRRGQVRMHVFDALGRKVKTLESGELPAGRHQLTWNGEDDSGGNVASGTYFIHLSWEGAVLTRKAVLLK